MLGRGPISSTPVGVTALTTWASTGFSWPMMWIGDGVPVGWVNTDAGDVVGAVDGSTAVDAWSDNPAICLRDFMLNRAKLVVDEGYAAAAAQRCDELVTGPGGTEKRCTITLALADKRPVRDWIETMRAYVPAWVVDAGTGWRIVADMPRAVDHFFGAGTIDASPSPTITRTGTRDTPNAVDIQYTDITNEPWESYNATAELTGASELRRSSVSLPGIRRYSQAKRFAIERLNHYTLEDTVGTMSIFDYGLRVLPGDVAQVSESAFGWAGQPVRILAVSDKGNGRWDVEFRDYDPAAYSNEVQLSPSIPETALSSPLSVLAPTGLTATEFLSSESNLTNSGIGTGIIFQSRIRVAFTESADPYLSHYLVNIYADPAYPLYSRIERGVGVFVSGVVRQLTSYTVDLVAVNTLGAQSPVVSTTLFINGKQFPPGDVPAITRATEVGGEVLLAWEPAADFDTLRYEWRVDLGNAGLAWAAMDVVDSIDGLRARFIGFPAGTHRFCVRAIDSVGRYSINSRCAVVTVTTDTNAFLADPEFVSPTLVNMVKLISMFDPAESSTLHPRWITNAPGTSWDASLPSPVDAGTLPVFVYGAGAVISSWRGEPVDLGTDIAGDYSIIRNLTVLRGAVKEYIEHSADGTTWVQEEVTGGLKWRGSARFIRPFFTSVTAGDSFLIEGPPRIGISAEERTESGGPVMSSASLPTTITLTNKFTKLTRVSITPVAPSGRFPTVDNIVIGATVTNHFDAYLFDATDLQVADNFFWSVSGV